MAKKENKLLKCVAVAIVLCFVVTSFVPVVTGSGWYRSFVLSSGLLFTQIGAGDVDRDGSPEVYVATMKGRLFKVTYTGNTWSSIELPSVPDSVQAMLIDDLNNDGYDEIFIASEHASDNGRIYRITYNGANWVEDIVYKNFASSDYPMDLAAGDVNRDGLKDLYWIEAGGALRYGYVSSSWVFNTIDTKPAGYFRCLTTGDANYDGHQELYLGTDDNKIVAMGWTGWSWNSAQVGDSGFDSYWDFVRDLVIGDADHSGSPEIYFVAGDRYIMALEYKSLTNEWVTSIVHDTSEVAIANKLALGDGNADGQDELFEAASNNTVYSHEWNATLQHWVRNDVSGGSLPSNVMSVVVAEVDGEPNYKEVYVPCEDGNVYRFARDVDPPPAPIVWSDTHPVQEWRNITVVKVLWRIGTDISGIGGFSYVWSVGTPLVPVDTTVDLTPSRDSLDSPPFSDSKDIYFGIRAVDGAGNWGFTTYYGPIYIDVTPPHSVSFTLNDGLAFTNSQYVSMSISANDTLSGLFNMSLSNDRKHWSDWVPYQEKYSGWDINVNSPAGIADGPRTVYLRVQDKAGNVAAPVSATIGLDQTPPKGLDITINDGGRYTSNPAVTLNISWDPNPDGAKVTAMAFSNDNNIWSNWENLATYKGHWSLTNDPGGWADDGEHKVYFRVLDEAGNIGGPIYAPIVLDRTAPYGLYISINGGQLVTKNTTVTLTLKAEDSPERSGLGFMSFKQDEYSVWSPWVEWNSKTSFEITTGDSTKTIYYRVKDKAGNEATPVKSFIVLDSATPKITHVRVLGISDKGAVITWSTDIPANSVVRYGLTVNYNNAPSNGDMVTEHSVTLTGLRSNTDYHFRVESTDQPGVNPTTSMDYTFTTKALADTIPPTITDLKIEGVTATTAVISWKTDEPSDTRLRYGTDLNYAFVEGDGKDKLEHRVVLRYLTPSTFYYIEAQSSDNRGNGPTEKASSFTTTSTYDTEAPTITNLEVTGLTDKIAIVTWNTNEPSQGIIEYGTTSSYGKIAVSERYETVHRVVLSGLTPDTMYHLIVRAIDVAGNGPTTTDEFSFFTLKDADRSPPVITNVKSDNIQATSAVISWATDEPSDSGVAYRSSKGEGQTIYEMDLVETHSLAMGGLKPDTDYTFTVESMDASGNGPTISAEYYFHTGTTSDTEAPMIYNITVLGQTNVLAVVYWDTDKEAQCVLEYGRSSKDYTFQVQEEGYFAQHGQVLRDLVPQTDYYLRLQCTDPEGHGPTLSDEVKFSTTVAADNEQPTITNLKVWNITTTTVTIEWRTGEPADSELHFGKDVNMDQVARDKRYVLTHKLELQGLSPNTTYQFTVLSTDPSGNTGSGQKLTFTTNSIYVPPVKTCPDGSKIPVSQKCPGGGGGGTSIVDAMPWILLVIVLALVLGLTGYMYHEGLLKFGGGTKTASSTTPRSLGGTSAAPSRPMVAAPMATDEGLCPHCHGQISLSAAAQELSRERDAEEERKRQQEESERLRREAAEAHQRKLHVHEQRARSIAATTHRTPPVRQPGPQAESEFVEVQTSEGVQDGASEDELSSLYDEVERERSRKGHRAGQGGHQHAGPPKAATSQASGQTPLKTVKCGHCGGRVPVYTDKRPVRITCPSCNKSGTLRGQ
jgi:hypothetical protein